MKKFVAVAKRGFTIEGMPVLEGAIIGECTARTLKGAVAWFHDIERDIDPKWYEVRQV